MNPDNGQQQPTQPQQAAPVVGQVYSSDAPQGVVSSSDVTTPPSPSPAAMPSAGVPAPAMGQSKSKGKMIALVVVVILVLGAGAYFGLMAMSNANAKSTAKDFISDLNQGSSSKAYTLTTANLQKMTSESAFSAKLGTLFATNPTFAQAKLSSGTSKVVYTVTENGLPAGTDGSTSATFTLSLARQGLDNWKVDSVGVVD